MGRTSKVLLLTHLTHGVGGGGWGTGLWFCPRDRVSQGLEPKSLNSLVQRSPTTSSHFACSCPLLGLTPFGSIALPLAGCLLRGGRQIG